MTTTTRRPPKPAAHPTDWQWHAACADVDPGLFFPTGSTRQIAAQTEAAKRVCAGCPVRAECLAWAVETRQDAGVWGGLTKTERRDLLRRRTPHTREVFIEKALYSKPKRPAVAQVLDRYWRVVELRQAGWGRRRLAEDLGVSAESVVAAERLVQETGSVESALGSLGVAA